MKTYIHTRKKIPISTKSQAEHMVTNNTDLFILDPVSEIEVLKIISNFKDSSAGWNELKPPDEEYKRQYQNSMDPYM